MVSDYHLDRGEGFEEFLEELIANNRLDENPAGIAKQVIHQGFDSLSDKQKHVFKKNVIDEFVTPECSRCGGDIPWSEMYEAHHNGRLCSWCAHMVDKDD